MIKAEHGSSKSKPVRTPRQCIHDFCMRNCKEMERANSKRCVAECIKRSCPLHPYRTGKLRWKSSGLSNFEKERRATRLRTARRSVEKYRNQLDTIQKKTDEIRERAEKRIEEAKKQRQNAQEEYEKALKKVEDLEKAFDHELEEGLWK